MGRQDEESPSFLTVNLHLFAIVLAFFTGGISWSVYERHAAASAYRAYEAERHGPWGGTPVAGTVADAEKPCGPDGPSTDIEFFLDPACLATLSDGNLMLMHNQAANMLANKSVSNLDELERVRQAIEQELKRRLFKKKSVGI